MFEVSETMCYSNDRKSIAKLKKAKPGEKKDMNEKHYIKSIDSIEKLYDRLNERFFESAVRANTNALNAHNRFVRQKQFALTVGFATSL